MSVASADVRRTTNFQNKDLGLGNRDNDNVTLPFFLLMTFAWGFHICFSLPLLISQRVSFAIAVVFVVMFLCLESCPSQKVPCRAWLNHLCRERRARIDSQLVCSRLGAIIHLFLVQLTFFASKLKDHTITFVAVEHAYRWRSVYAVNSSQLIHFVCSVGRIVFYFGPTSAVLWCVVKWAFAFAVERLNTTCRHWLACCVTIYEIHQRSN